MNLLEEQKLIKRLINKPLDYMFSKFKKVRVSDLKPNTRYIAFSSSAISIGQLKCGKINASGREIMLNNFHGYHNSEPTISLSNGLWSICVKSGTDNEFMGGNFAHGYLFEITPKLPECFKRVEEK